MIGEKIKQWIAETLDVSMADFILEHPADLKNGDYSTNVAMVLAKKRGENPNTLAESFVAKLSASVLPEISKIEIAGPGFINFTLANDFLVEGVGRVFDKEPYGKSLKGKKVIVEYTDPNPFKEFHIGHLMTNSIGESIANLFEKSGAEVKRACYQGDVGIHVASAVYGMKKIGNINSISDLGRAYALGATEAKENGSVKEEIAEINKKIYEKSDEEINKLYDHGRAMSLAYFESIYEKLGTKFDFYFFESETGIFGKKIVEEFLPKGVFEESDGAVIYNGEKHGLHSRVFINSHGLPTYEAKELGLAKLKYDTYQYEDSFVVTANEVEQYFRVIKSAMGEVFPELAKITHHVPHGMMKLPSGKMSSRTGDVITFVSLLEEVKGAVFQKMKDTEIDDKENVAEIIAIGAIKYSILKSAPGKDIIFDMEKATSLDGDSGPYIQYTAVRARSVVNKSVFGKGVGKLSQIKAPEKITNVEKLIYRLPEIVHLAQINLAPHMVAQYLLSLASEFNSFYAETKIIGADDEEYYVCLCKAVSEVLQEGLRLLAIKVPEKM